MKTRPAPGGARYRSAEVYRSAERLIALAAHPRRKRRWFPQFLIRPPRGPGILAALLLGLAAGFVLWRTTDDIPLTAQTSAQETLTTHVERSPANSSQSATSPASLPTVTTRSSNTAPTSASASDDSKGRARPASDLLAKTTPSSITRARPTARVSQTVVLSPEKVTLRGQLRSAGQPPVEVEFVLQTTGGKPPEAISGLVRYLNGEWRLAANSVIGERTENTLTLRETGPIWTRGESMRVGRRFVITLPKDTALPEFTGTWTFETATGTLHLAIASPW